LSKIQTGRPFYSSAKGLFPGGQHFRIFSVNSDCEPAYCYKKDPALIGDGKEACEKGRGRLWQHHCRICRSHRQCWMIAKSAIWQTAARFLINFKVATCASRLSSVFLKSLFGA
jgi:hypothetical protein